MSSAAAAARFASWAAVIAASSAACARDFPMSTNTLSFRTKNVKKFLVYVYNRRLDESKKTNKQSQDT